MLLAHTNFIALLDVAVRILEQAKTELSCENATNRLVNAAHWNAAFANQLGYLLVPIDAVHMHIHTSHNRLIVSLLAA